MTEPKEDETNPLELVGPRWVIEQMADAIGFDDPEGNVVWGNAAFRRLFGVGPREPLGLLEEYVAPSSREAVRRRHRERFSGGSAPISYEFEAVRRDGRRLWVEASVVPLLREGTTVGSCAIIRDVTSRREREAALRRAQEQYRRLFERAFDAIIVFEPEGEIVLDVNPRACELYGRSREELVGMSLLSITRDSQPGREAVATVGEAGTIERFETVHFHRDGSELFLECSASMIEYQGRQAVLTINRDLTERRRLQQRLTHAEKMEGVGQLAAGVAHEFNNVLAAILSTAEALLDEGPSPPTRALLEQMIARGHAGAEITRELLALSRKHDEAAKELSVDEHLRAVSAWLAPLLGDDVEIELTLDASTLRVCMDPGQLEQLLLNLSINARDAMGGHGHLKVSTSASTLTKPRRTATHQLAPGTYVVLDVHDSGPGIPDAVRSRIFEPFFTTKQRGQGTGLGLATVYSIVDRLDGGIDVTNAAGARFTLYLPAREGTAATDAAPTAEDEARPIVPKTLLLVDDEVVLAKALARGLRGAGYEVLTAHDAAAARRLLHEHGSRLDLLLTDVSMPGGSGLKLARDAVETVPGLRVLVMSGYADRGLPPELSTAGFVQKPFTRAVLIRRIREMLEGQP